MKSLKLLLLFLSISSCKKEKLGEDLLIKSKEIHERVMTLDTHVDIDVANFTDSVNYSQKLKNQVNLPRMEEGGLDVAFFIVYTGQGALTAEGYNKAYENAMSKFKAIHKLTKEIAPQRIALARTSEEAREIYASGKKVAMIGVENAYPLGTDISRVKQFYDLGARYMSLSHNGHSQFCDSNTGEQDSIWVHNGVSDLGKKVIQEMNKWGIMIDVSHPSKKAMKDMIALSKAPIIASHSSARALCNHSRNLDDEQLGWLKENGGVVQTVAFGSYLSTEKTEAREKALKKVEMKVMDSLGVQWMSLKEFMKLPIGKERDSYLDAYFIMKDIVKEKAKKIKNLPPDVNVSDFVDHIDYLVEKIGIEHVGISSDFDGGGGIDGWNDASETLNVTIELVKRGYTEEQIEQLWSGNLLRVLDEVQEIANEIQAKEK